MGGSTTPFRLDGKVAVVTGAARGKRVFGIFKRFPNEGGRNAHLSGRGAARLMAQSNTLLAKLAEISKLDIIGEKLG